MDVNSKGAHEKTHLYKKYATTQSSRHSDLYYIKVYSKCVILGSIVTDCKMCKNKMTFLLLHSMNCEY